MMNKKISIIMLVYNTNKQLLDKSIGSLLHQTYKNLEIILLDDCSTSKETIDTLKYYEDKYENIRIVKHEANHGMLRGRVTGFKNCTGDYIAYLDSDDTASIDYYRTLLQKAVDQDADLVVSTFNKENDSGDITYYTRCHFRNKTYDLKGEEIFAEYMHQQGKNHAWSLVWNKLYRRDLLEKAIDDIEAFSLSHNGLNMTEDIAFTCAVFLKAQHMVSCMGEGVNYYFHSGQSIHVNNDIIRYNKKINDVANVFKFMGHLIQKYDVADKYNDDFIMWKSLYAYYYITGRPNSMNEIEAEQRLKEIYNIKDIVVSCPEIEDYYYREISNTTSDYHYRHKMISSIISDKTKVVSFDIFDTLIMRNVFEPKDIFCYLDVEFNKLNKKSYIMFHRIRIEAEANVRKIVDREEITFDEIYDYIEDNYLISHDMCEKLKAKEIELELKYITPRKFGRKLYDIAKQNGKKIVFTSDMYLDIHSIQSLLHKCGYIDDVTIYLSSEINKTKHTGTLYHHVLKTEGINPSEMVHIGDNYHADYEMADKIGISAYHILSTRDKFYNTIYHPLFEKNFQYIGMFDIYERLLMRSMFGLVQNKLFDDSLCGFDINSIFNGQPRHLGYFAIGMELVALLHWITDKVKGYNKIHFVARDGYLPMLAYQELKKYNSNLPLENYLYISRKALLLLDVKNQDDLNSLDTKMAITNLSPKKIAEYFNPTFVNTKILKSKLSDHGISYEDKFSDRESFYKAIQLFDGEVVDYKRHTEYCAKIVNSFKKDITQDNRFFDIGYSGRAESILSDLLGYPIDSLYIHTNSDAPAIRSQIGGFHIDTFLQYAPKIRGHIREHIFMKNAPSLIRYELDGDEVNLVFEEYKSNIVTDTVTSIVQESALDFVRDFYSNFYEYMDWLSFPEQYAAFPYERYINDPIEKDRQIFSCVLFEDDLGVGVDHNLMDIWITSSPNVDGPKYIPSLRPAIKIAKCINVVLPVGSRRRRLAKKVYNGLKKVYHFIKPKKRKNK